MRVDQPMKIDSSSDRSRAARNRAGLLSMAVSSPLPEDSGAVKETTPRPCLEVLPGGAKSDVELIRCFRGGEWRGFTALYDRYFSTAYSICRQQLTCSETALDSTNDTFLAMIAESDYLDPYRLSDWVVDTAHHLAARRAHHRQEPASNDSRTQLAAFHPGNDSGMG